MVFLHTCDTPHALKGGGFSQGRNHASQVRRVQPTTLALPGDQDRVTIPLVGDVLTGLAMRPKSYLLLALGCHALAVRHVAHITYSYCTCLTFFRPVYHSTADLMLDVAGALLLLG